MKKFLFYTLILAFLMTSKGVFASSASLNYQTKQQISTNEVSLQVNSVTELPSSVAISSSNNLEVSLDGKVAFISAPQTDFVYAYDLNNGELLSQIKTGKNIASLSLFDDGQKKLLAVVNLNNSTSPVTISLLDISNAKKIKVLSAFILPPELSLYSTIKPVFDPKGEHLLIASKNPANLFVFEVKSGQMIDQVPLSSGANKLNIFQQENNLLVATTSITEGKITVFDLDSQSKLHQKSAFLLPVDSAFIANNNLCFNRLGTIAYIAAAKGNKLFSFNTSDGSLIDSYEVGDVPAQIALASLTSKNRIAVVNTGKNHGFLANSVSIVESDNNGYFTGATVFLPELGVNLVADSTIKFNYKGNIGFVGARNQSLLAFDARTGEQLTETKLIGSATKFYLSQDKLVALTNDNDLKRLIVLDIASNKKQNTKIQDSPFEKLEITADLKKSSKATSNNSTTISTIKINQVKACRVNHIVKVKVYGKGFDPNSQLLVNNQVIATSYIRETRLAGRFATKILAGKRDFNVTIKNSDGTSSLLFKKHLRCRR